MAGSNVATPTATHDDAAAALTREAVSLAETFKGRVAEAEKLRRVPDANMAAIKDAGLVRVI